MYLNFKQRTRIAFSSVCAQGIMFNPLGCCPAVFTATRETQNLNLHTHNHDSHSPDKTAKQVTILCQKEMAFQWPKDCFLYSVETCFGASINVIAVVSHSKFITLPSIFHFCLFYQEIVMGLLFKYFKIQEIILCYSYSQLSG